MRIKKVKGAKEQIDSSKYVIKNPLEYKGNYSKMFGNNNSIYIEIGMGKGDFIIKNALLNPNINFIGIERYDSVIVRAVQKLESMNLLNVKLIRFNANEINNIFDKEIDRIYLNFSDPWPKDRHEKRRLTSDVFLEKYEKILRKKSIIMKTDNRKLFEYSITSFSRNNYKIKDISLNLHQDNITDNIETEYEKKYKEKGFPIYKLEVYK